MCFFLLGGCASIENVYIPNVFGDDEVPEEVKAQPGFIVIEGEPEEAIEPVIIDEKESADGESWPRLGDVPFKPKDFTPPEEYDQTMAKMENDRAEADEARAQAADLPMAEPIVLMQSAEPFVAAEETPQLRPPQFILK